jgi:hypothetical protein
MNVDEALLVADQTVGFAVLSQSHALLVLAAEVRRQHAEIERLRSDIQSLNDELEAALTRLCFGREP